MIQDIKKYNVWIVYVCMWLFSFFTRLVHRYCDVLYVGACDTKWLCLRFY